MAHGKETPRQKMIGMMYLVLTAMLALNVSKEVLDAFTLVDGGLTTTTQNFAAKNEGLYDKFNIAFEQNPEKVGDWKTRAEEVREMSNELYEFLNLCKIEIVSKKDEEAIHDGEVHLADVDSKDDTNFPAEIMLVNKRGIELKNKIEEYRGFLLTMVEDKETYTTTVEAVESILSTEVPETMYHNKKKGETPTWESTYFEHLPLASVITLLSKMQGDVRNVEAEMLNFLLGQVDAGDFKVNVIEPVVIAKSNYVFKGVPYQAEVFLAAYDSTNIPEVKLENGTILETQGGKGIYEVSYNSIGIKKWGGVISVEKDGQVTSKPFYAEFEVAESNATVSATGMNVFYRGIPNPVEISVGGVAERDVVAQISSGNIKRVGSGTYEVKPGVGSDKATVSVFANIQGQRKLMSRADFRVYDLPKPDAVVEGIPGSSGALTVGRLSQLQNVRAEAKDFVFEVDYKVESFEVAFMGSGGIWSSMPSSNDRFTSQQKELFRQLRSGQRVMIEKIKASGPDGVIRNLNSITITVR
ncbi:MAG: gliding motility protein GldM [Bacteroidales bacterium]|nr:gliding motility protein GldM [Bacteroidales bacterium]